MICPDPSGGLPTLCGTSIRERVEYPSRRPKAEDTAFLARASGSVVASRLPLTKCADCGRNAKRSEFAGVFANGC